jgi:vitamin B12 transporter
LQITLMNTYPAFTIFLLSLATLVIPADAASLTGVIKDAQGRPVPDASVTLFARNSEARNTTTGNPQGVYTFDGISPGDYILRIESPGFAPFLAEAIHLEAAPVTVDATLQVAIVRQQIVVTASSTPQTPEEVSKAVTVIGHAEADERNAASLADVVNSAPGVHVEQLGGPGSFTGIHIRGLRVEDTAVLIDGMRLRDPSATQADASGLIEDLLFTDSNRVEVMRGSGSSLYGTNAIGGVVNVITDECGGRTRGSVLLEGGSLGTFRGRTQVAGQLGGGRVQYSLGVAEMDVTGGIGGINPYRDTSAQGSITFHLAPSARLIARAYTGDSFVKLMGEAVPVGPLNEDAAGIINAVPVSQSVFHLFEQGTPVSQLAIGNASYIPAPTDTDSTRAGRYFSGALTLLGQATPKLNYSVSFQTQTTSRRYGDGPAGTGFQPDGSTRSVYDGRIQTVNAHADYQLGRRNLLSGGYEFESENYAFDSSDAANAAAFSAVNVTQNSHAVFAQDQAGFFGGRLQLSAAFRAQFFALDHPVLTPLETAPYQGIAFASPGAAYTGDGSAAWFFRKTGTKLRAHAGRGYRAPSLFERFGAGYDPVFGYSVYGDPRLKPEHSISVDAGVDQSFFHDRLRASATYFYTRLQHVIIFDESGAIDPATDPFGRFLGYRNTGGGLSRGAELSATLTPTRTLNITTAYTYVNAIERNPIVGDILQTFVIPRHQFSMVASQRLGSRILLTVDTVASSNYLAQVYGDGPLVYRFPGMHKLNLGASYRRPLGEHTAARFFVRAENILGQNYFESGFQTAGRTGYGGVQFEF